MSLLGSPVLNSRIGLQRQASIYAILLEFLGTTRNELWYVDKLYIIVIQTHEKYRNKASRRLVWQRVSLTMLKTVKSKMRSLEMLQVSHMQVRFLVLIRLEIHG